MKKSIVLIISAIFLASCTPKKPVATTTPVQGTQTITTTVFKTQGNKSNTSNTKKSLLGSNTVKKNDNKSNADNREANESEGNETRDESTNAENESNNNEAVEENNNTEVNNNTEANNEGNNEANTENASDDETSSVAIVDETIATPVIEANDTQVKLPAESSKLESAGFKIDWDSKKYSDADGKNYVHADFNGQDIILGLSDNDNINEIELKGTDAITIPGGFTVGSSKQEFRDKFGYWGGDIYTIDGTTYVLTGEDTIESITIKAE